MEGAMQHAPQPARHVAGTNYAAVAGVDSAGAG